MKPGVPLVATLLLHLALVAAILTGLAASQKTLTSPAPIRVALLSPPTIAATAPAPSNTEKPSRPPRPMEVPPRHRLKTHSAQRPVARPQAEPAPRPKPPETAAGAGPTAPAGAPAPSSTAPPQAAVTPHASPSIKTAASISASYAASNPFPPYPQMSLSNQEEGTVMLRVLVQPDGTAGDVQVKTSSGYALLDKSARTTVRGWRFNPATVDGKPVAQWYQVPIQFKLPDN
jgi:periplasmic protein TonB